MSERKRSSKRRIAIVSAVVVSVCIVIAVMWVKRQDHLERLEQTEAAAVDSIQQTEEAFEDVSPLTSAEMSALRTFRNEAHVEAAQELGVSGITSRADAEELVQGDELLRIERNPLYRIQDLDYSIPYLTPDAANLLDRIAHRFQSRLAEMGLPPYRFVVTSVTRSEEDQEALRQVNVNAAVESSHEYGTTFDIHYGKFDYEGQPAVPQNDQIYQTEMRSMLSEGYSELAQEHPAALKAVLGDVLLELQKENDAMVIYERRQPVYHITVSQPIAEAPPRARQGARSESDLVRLSQK